MFHNKIIVKFFSHIIDQWNKIKLILLKIIQPIPDENSNVNTSVECHCLD